MIAIIIYKIPSYERHTVPLCLCINYYTIIMRNQIVYIKVHVNCYAEII